MKITIKNLKVCEAMSEETTAYNATIYIDGEKAFNASNDGRGASDRFDRIGKATEAEVNCWVKAHIAPTQYGSGSYEADLEAVVCDLIEAAQAEKRLNRMIKSKVLVIDGHGSGEAIFTIKIAPTLVNIARLTASPKFTGTVVNGNPAAYQRALALV
jgi:hypothetical protein